jgi:type I restriction enzyme S subunit
MISTEKQPAPGYKLTELGEIPQDWEIEKIGRIVSITTGNRNTQDRLPDGKYPFFVRSQKIESIDSYSFDGEAVLTAGDGVGTGKIFHYINGKFDYHQRVYLIHNFGDRIAGYYFYIYFSNFFYDRIMSMTAKSSVDSVRRETISEMQISLPPKEEQTAIANALSDVDSLLNELEALIEKKQAIKTATMQQLLTGKTRLPQFARYTEGDKQGQLKGMKDSELGEIPEDWDVVKLDSLADVIDPHPSHRAPPESQSGLPFLGIGDFDKHGNIIKSSFRTVGNSIYDEHRARYKVEEGVLGLGRVASIGKVVRLKSDIGNYTISPTLGVLKPHKIDLDYLFYFLESDLTKNQFMKIMSGSTRSSVGMIVLRELNILALPEKEAECIGKVLLDMDEEIQALEQRLAKTRQIKQGMMQELLTGRTRLPFNKES